MKIIPFSSALKRNDFDCGEPALNHYLQKLAEQHRRKNISRTFVAFENATGIADAGTGTPILGFYSLSMAQAELKDLPESLQRKLPPQYPVPLARLSRLAVDKSAQGKRLGEALLMNALTRCVRIANEIAMVGVVVDVKHEAAQRFYLKYGFVPYSTEPLTLFIAMQTIKRSLPAFHQ